MDQTYKNTPWSLDGPGTVIVRDSWLPWLRQYWLDLLKGFTPQAAAFVPAFIQAMVAQDDGTGHILIQKLDSDYFATKETAQYIANKYGDGSILEVAADSVGISTSPAKAWFIKLKDGRTVNAGQLAAFYQRNPEDQYPNVADNDIKALLGIA